MWDYRGVYLLLLCSLVVCHPTLPFAHGSTFSPVRAPSWPLAVRTPYLSAWLPGGAKGSILAGEWPQFWAGAKLGWAGIVRVDGTSYQFLGNPAEGLQNALPSVKQISAEFTATSTIFVALAGAINVTTTFLTPVTPHDLVRQSIPFSYMTVTISAIDDSSHQVEIYSDINGAWAVGNMSLPIIWSYKTSAPKSGKPFHLHEVSPSEPVPFGEVNEQSIYGSAIFATNQEHNVTVQSGSDVQVRGQFIASGGLSNTTDEKFPRPANDNTPVFAFAVNLGQVSKTSVPTPVVFAIGHMREQVIQYEVANRTTTQRSPYYASAFSQPLDAVSFFLDDYSNAVSSGQEIDMQIQDDALTESHDYAHLVSLSLRQVFGAVEITVGGNLTHGFDTSDVLMFMKEISSDGNINTVDVIMPSFPIFLYLNPDMVKYLLESLLQYQIQGLYPNRWAMHDMGFHFPNATGHPEGNDEQMPIEESGNMLIMIQAYTQFSKNTDLISKYYIILRQWADYLVINTLIPGFQLATTDAAGPLANQTNLAIKGILALGAMSKIAAATHHGDDAKYYLGVAQSYVPQWVDMSLGDDKKHIKLDYQNDSTWGIQFNLFADTLLDLHLIPQNVYDALNAWYPLVGNKYGVQLDTRVTWGKTDWNMWCAATSNAAIRTYFVETIMRYVEEGGSDGPLPDRYSTLDGTAVGGIRARPTVGAHFSILALLKK